ncbi:MHYT domain-containing protein [Longimicrobium sp.]|uniref:MHYT domain-containing protein n=1 Tax=Longimicrobium sp. TaxID=2029185 RepID=UPI002B9F26CD|nr:MHYT domain-containing protein [Longimicrobium sp.]HSU16087.1 MHYT domain-containing protein [Longimicrobium sp.]
MPGRYDATLVAVSVLIAISASYAALALAARIGAARGRFRAAWLLGGSVAVGLGIWSMHFVGMLALRLHMPVSYAVPTVLLSALVPVLASALALYVVSCERVSLAALLGSTLVMGNALAGMHFLGMASLRGPARVEYANGLVGVAALLAMGSALAIHVLGRHFRHEDAPRGRSWKPAAAVGIGAGIAAMHYTAMAAARFSPAQPRVTVAPEAVLQTPGLAWGIAAATLTLLGTIVFGALVERRARARSAETEALRRSEDRFRSLVVATAQIIWTTNEKGEFAAEQPEWAAFTGGSFDEYRGWRWLECVHPDDREQAAATWRAALESRTLYETEYRLQRHDGRWRDMQVRAVPVLEPGGRVREWVGAETDITERRKADRAARFLSEASRALVSSLDYPATLRAVARLAVPELADWCAVDLLAEGGGVERVAVEHPDPAKVEFVHRLEALYPADPLAERGLPQVIRTGRAEMMADIPEELITAAAKDPEHLALIRELGLRSYIVVPLIARDRTLGAITLVHAESGRRYDEQDLRLAEELARRAAVAIDNARLFQETEDARAQLEQQAAELQEAQAEMEMAHDELQRANDELLARTAEAERARAAADEANAAKSSFLATMSHELRTPLNAIAGYAQLLEMGIHGEVSDTQREYLEKIRRNQTHLLGLINDVLNFAKIEAGQVQYEIGDVPVDETLAAVEALIEPQVRARRHQYTYRRGNPSVTAHADRDRVEQVVLNLLSNAVKFTSPGGRIVLEWEAEPAVVRVRVRDSGRGIPPEKLPAIFEPFVQVDPTLTRSSEGTGLGLAISRDLARAMKGDLTVDSREGEGSVFTLTLPRGPDRAAPVPEIEAEAGVA